MPTKLRRGISISADVWEQAQAQGRQLRTSASWVTEEALRHYFKATKARRTDAPEPQDRTRNRDSKLSR